MIQVFISHKKADEELAKKVSAYLSAKKLTCWIDVLDEKIKSTADITKYIVEQIDASSNVLVVFTTNTVGSMWVPFELGVGYKGGKGLAAFIDGNPVIPEYLGSFPQLRSSTDLDKFAQQINEQSALKKSINENRMITADAKDRSYSEEFIHKLKTKLGQ